MLISLRAPQNMRGEAILDSSQLNNIVEYKNWTLEEIINVMLISSETPQNIWGETILIVNYIINEVYKTVNCVFIRHVYNNNAYWFLIHKSSIEDIHLSIIMESMNVIFFEEVFPSKEARKHYWLKRMNKASTSNHHQLEDDEVEFRKR
jgi:hypothetical protein